MSFSDILADAVKGIPITEVLRERLALAEQQYTALEREVAKLKIEKDYIETQNRELRAELQERAAQINALEIAVQKEHEANQQKQSADLPEPQHKLLLFLARPGYHPMISGAIAHHNGMNEHVAQHHLDALKDGAYVDWMLNMGGALWILARKGRAYLIERKLL